MPRASKKTEIEEIASAPAKPKRASRSKKAVAERAIEKARSTGDWEKVSDATFVAAGPYAGMTAAQAEIAIAEIDANLAELDKFENLNLGVPYEVASTPGAEEAALARLNSHDQRDFYIVETSAFKRPYLGLKLDQQDGSVHLIPVDLDADKQSDVSLPDDVYAAVEFTFDCSPFGYRLEARDAEIVRDWLHRNLRADEPPTVQLSLSQEDYDTLIAQHDKILALETQLKTAEDSIRHEETAKQVALDKFAEIKLSFDRVSGQLRDSEGNRDRDTKALVADLDEADIKLSAVIDQLEASNTKRQHALASISELAAVIESLRSERISIVADRKKLETDYSALAKAFGRNAEILQDIANQSALARFGNLFSGHQPRVEPFPKSTRFSSEALYIRPSDKPKSLTNDEIAQVLARALGFTLPLTDDEKLDRAIAEMDQAVAALEAAAPTA